MSTLVAPELIVARKPCGCVVASTAASEGVPHVVERDIAAWEQLGLTVERIPRRDIRSLPWASLGNGWCVHDPPRPPLAGGGGPQYGLRTSVSYEDQRELRGPAGGAPLRPVGGAERRQEHGMRRQTIGVLLAVLLSAGLAGDKVHPQTAEAGIDAPAPNLTSRTADRGNGYGQTEWLDANGAVYDLGLVFRLPAAVVVAFWTDAPSLIRDASRRWGLDAGQMLRIATCESRLDPAAYNRRSGASGLFQFLPGTFAYASRMAGYGGASPFDPVANVEAASWLMKTEGPRHWVCR